MVAGIPHRKVFSAVMGLGLALVLASTASAVTPPQLDTRNGTTNVVALTGPTAVVTTELWAVVTDGNSTADDFVRQVTGSAYSSYGGIIYGNLSITRLFPFETVNGYNGVSADLDGDGATTDKDRGATATDTVTGWIYMPAYVVDPLDEENRIPGPTPSPAHLATLTFTGTGWVAGNPHGVTKLWVVGHPNPSATAWIRDGVEEQGQAATGTMVTLYRPAAAVVGPTLTLGVATPTGDLDGSASTGTISTWEWLIDGKATNLTGEHPNVSWAYCVGTLGLAPDATYGVTLKLSSDYETNVLGTGSVHLDATPEPATLALLAFGGLAMLARRRRSA